jgi:hypothetical protein
MARGLLAPCLAQAGGAKVAGIKVAGATIVDLAHFANNLGHWETTT